MPRNRSVPIRALALAFVFVLVPVLSSCGDDSTEPEDTTLVGTWEAQSFTALGTDFIADGMGLTVTLEDGGMYTFEVSNDQIGICSDQSLDCSEGGQYMYTDTELTIDPGTPDEVTFGYTIQGSTMTWNGSIDSVPATVVFTKQ